MSLHMYNHTQLAELHGSPMARFATDLRSFATNCIHTMQDLISQAQAHALLPCNTLTTPMLCWGLTMVLTRAISMRSRDNLEVLAPWADLVNHDVTCECFFDWDHASHALVLHPDRAYSPGQQVFVSYGQKPSGQLLLCYGFCPHAGTNPHDAVLVSMGLDVEEDHAGLKLGVLLRYCFFCGASSMHNGHVQWAANKQFISLHTSSRRHGLSPVRDFEMHLNRMPSSMLPYAALLSDDSGDERALEALARAVVAADEGEDTTAMLSDGMWMGRVLCENSYIHSLCSLATQCTWRIRTFARHVSQPSRATPPPWNRTRPGLKLLHPHKQLKFARHPCHRHQKQLQQQPLPRGGGARRNVLLPAPARRCSYHSSPSQSRRSRHERRRCGRCWRGCGLGSDRFCTSMCFSWGVQWLGVVVDHY